MEKCIRNIQLIQQPVTNGNHCKKKANVREKKYLYSQISRFENTFYQQGVLWDDQSAHMDQL